MMTEFAEKQARVRALLEERDLDGLVLRRASSLAWATCGARMQVGMASSVGVAVLLITRAECHLITDNLEADRLREEEGLEEQGWCFHVHPWYEKDEALERLSRGLRLGADTGCWGTMDLGDDMARLRSRLTPEEQARMRITGRACADAITGAAFEARVGNSEQEISAWLGYHAVRLGLEPLTNIVAADERIVRFRHALATPRRIERHVMLVLSARRSGLVCSVTRFVHFGAMPDDLRRAHAATALIAAECIEATRPGVPLGEVLDLAAQRYAAAGEPSGWRLHHQGGVLGYETREILITPLLSETVRQGQAVVWNPSIGAARSVDSFLVSEDGNEIVTASAGWPLLPVQAGSKTYLRPAVLEWNRGYRH